MADTKMTGRPLDGSQNVSRGTDTYLKRYQYKDPLVDMEFSSGTVLSKNQGRDVSLDSLSVDTPQVTGKNEGFFKQNQGMIKKLSR